MKTLNPVIDQWREAYAAFVGAFDTPIARRKISDEYADDARNRLRSFNQLLVSALDEDVEPTSETAPRFLTALDGVPLYDNTPVMVFSKGKTFPLLGVRIEPHEVFLCFDGFEENIVDCSLPPQEPSGHVHVDDFVSLFNPDNGDTRYAQWFLFLHRLPASLQFSFAQFTEDLALFCTHNGTRYRVTGASRFGDIYLTTDFTQSVGYEKRGVYVDQCEAFSKEP